MLLCRIGPLPCKSDKTWAAIFLPYCVRAYPSLQQKVARPCQRTRPPLFCLIFPEAVLLRKNKDQKSIQIQQVNGIIVEKCLKSFYSSPSADKLRKESGKTDGQKRRKGA